MPKHFSSMPPEIEQYNPEAIQLKDFVDRKTFNDAGKLHSFNDKPASVEILDNVNYYISWHSNGNLFRAGNKPAMVTTEPNTYSTWNNNDKLHSFDDNPAIIYSSKKGNTFKLEWKRDGASHRDDDKPSSILVTKDEPIRAWYHLNGCLHRDNNLPAEINGDVKTWMIQGQLHNRTGPAAEYDPFGENNPMYEYGLYGLKLPLSSFNKAQAYSTSKNVPLWVAVLNEYGFLKDEQMEIFTDSHNSSLPAAWLLRSMGINNETFKIRVKGKHGENHDYGFYDHNWFNGTHLDSFLKAISFEYDNLSTKERNND